MWEVPLSSTASTAALVFSRSTTTCKDSKIQDPEFRVCSLESQSCFGCMTCCMVTAALMFGRSTTTCAASGVCRVFQGSRSFEHLKVQSFCHPLHS